MDTSPILSMAGYLIYAAMAAVALYGVFCIILLARRITQKRFSNSNASGDFLDECRGLLKQRKFDEVAEICDSPGYWAKAVPQLIIVAIHNRTRGLKKLRQILAHQHPKGFRQIARSISFFCFAKFETPDLKHVDSP